MCCFTVSYITRWKLNQCAHTRQVRVYVTVTWAGWIHTHTHTRETPTGHFACTGPKHPASLFCSHLVVYGTCVLTCDGVHCFCRHHPGVSYQDAALTTWLLHRLCAHGRSQLNSPCANLHRKDSTGDHLWSVRCHQSLALAPIVKWESAGEGTSEGDKQYRGALQRVCAEILSQCKANVASAELSSCLLPGYPAD